MRDDKKIDHNIQGRALVRMPSLDGIRAVAVVLTSLVHVVPRWVPGGIFGVDMFFVLSGFLITSILLSSIRVSGTVDLKAFYVGRVRRLLPAVALLLAVFTAVVLVSRHTDRDVLVAAVVDAGVLLYVFNWSDAFGHHPPWEVDHLWSLSVEEQFYLLWPLVLVVVVRRLPRRYILALTAGGAVLSSVAQGITFVGTHSSAWAYLTTPLHASGILVGCLLGEIYTWGMAERALHWLGRWEWPAWAGALGLGLLALTTGPDDTFTYVGGMLLAVLAAAVLIASMIAHDVRGSSGLLHRFLSCRLMVGIGKRSYSLYLWQNFMAWTLVSLRRTALYLPVNFAVTALAAELSYRFVERRFMRRTTGHSPSSAALVPGSVPGRSPGSDAGAPPAATSSPVRVVIRDTGAVQPQSRAQANGSTDGTATV